MRIVHYLTFGRSSSFLVELLVGSIPILFALSLQTPPVFFSDLSTGVLTITSLVMILIYFVVSIWLLSEASASTYSPKLHEPRTIALSSIMFLFFSSIIVLFSYFVLVNQSIDSLIGNRRNIAAGIILTQVYAILAVAAHSSNLINRTKQSEKRQLISDFQEAADNIRKSNNIGENRTVLRDVGGKLAEKLAHEPMANETRTADFESWLTKFEESRSQGQKKMVRGEGEPDELAEPWRSLCKTYSVIEQELYTMTAKPWDKIKNVQEGDCGEI